jgi:diacylglycerol kinase (ATP)
MSESKFTIKGRLNSFACAANGIWTMLREEHNAYLHAVATILVVVAGNIFHVSTIEWCLLVLAITGVWMAEALNTALEVLADVAMPDFHPMVEKAKDVAAGGVLITSIGALVIAILIFVPYFIK